MEWKITEVSQEGEFIKLIAEAEIDVEAFQELIGMKVPGKVKEHKPPKKKYKKRKSKYDDETPEEKKARKQAYDRKWHAEHRGENRAAATKKKKQTIRPKLVGKPPTVEYKDITDSDRVELKRKLERNKEALEDLKEEMDDEVPEE